MEYENYQDLLLLACLDCLFADATGGSRVYVICKAGLLTELRDDCEFIACAVCPRPELTRDLNEHLSIYLNDAPLKNHSCDNFHHCHSLSLAMPFAKSNSVRRLGVAAVAIRYHPSTPRHRQEFTVCEQQHCNAQGNRRPIVEKSD